MCLWCAKKKKKFQYGKKIRKYLAPSYQKTSSPFLFLVHVLEALDAALPEGLSLGSRGVFSHGALCPHENEERRGSTDVPRAMQALGKVLTPTPLSVPSRCGAPCSQGHPQLWPDGTLPNWTTQPGYGHRNHSFQRGIIDRQLPAPVLCLPGQEGRFNSLILIEIQILSALKKEHWPTEASFRL